MRTTKVQPRARAATHYCTVNRYDWLGHAGSWLTCPVCRHCDGADPRTQIQCDTAPHAHARDHSPLSLSLSPAVFNDLTTVLRQRVKIRRPAESHHTCTSPPKCRSSWASSRFAELPNGTCRFTQSPEQRRPRRASLQCSPAQRRPHSQQRPVTFAAGDLSSPCGPRHRPSIRCRGRHMAAGERSRHPVRGASCHGTSRRTSGRRIRESQRKCRGSPVPC